MIILKDDIQEAKERLDAWWDNRAADRALLQVRGLRAAPVFEYPAREAASVHDWWTNPDVVLSRILNEASVTWFGGESFPVLQPVSGRIVSILCKYLGAPNTYIDKNTTWSEPIIHNWEDMPSLEWDENNPWWIITQRNMEACAAAIDDLGLECFMGHPDLNGPTEALAGLRNPEQLCIDLILEPERVKAAARKVQDAWFRAWEGVRRIAGRFGGCFTFMNLWSDCDAPDLQSDFSTLISTEMFEEFILPLLREQMEHFPRSVFHLDGPDMVRHLDLLLAEEKLNAIQWVEGAGAGPVSEWINLMRRIQDGGKSLYIYCEPWEVPVLLKNLSPTGLIMVVRKRLPLHEAKALLATVERLS